MKSSRKEMLFSQLHSLLTAGLDFNRSFELLIECERDDSTKRLLKKIYASIINGETLWFTLKSSNQFKPLDYGVIRIGEETGKLAETLAFLTDYYHKKIAQSRMVSSALSYPLIILSTAAMVVIFMVMVVVPMFEQVYARMGSELPALTRAVISFSKSFPIFFALITLSILSIGAFIYLRKEKESTQRIVAAIVLRIPLAGTIVKYNCQCSFCKLLYLLTVSGLPLLHGIQLLEEIITFYPYRKSFAKIATALEQGASFSQGMEEDADLYNKKLLTLLRVGEESNKLPFMFQRQGEELTTELEYKLKSIGTLLEPILILLIGVMVAIILISMYLPMFKLGGVIN